MKNSPFQFIKKNFQIIYSVVLIIFIPAAIVFNTLIVRSTFENNIEQESYRSITSIGEAINAGLVDVIGDHEKLQTKIKSIANFNKDITSLDVLVKDGEKFVVAASLDEIIIGQTSNDVQNMFAWYENKPVAFITNSATPNAVNQNTSNNISSDRYRVLTKPLIDSDGNKIALLLMKVSLAETDALSSYAFRQSMLILFITIVIIILLLINNTRLFEYATLYRKLKEVDEMKDEFISMASHELRTPVTGIRGYVSMILDGTYGPIGDKIKESLTIVANASTRLADLVEDLLNVSRIEQGRIQIKKQPTDIVPIVRSIMAELQIQADRQKISLAYKETSNSIPLLNIDPDRLKQILINLAGNAIKYTLQGSVEIATEYKQVEKIVEIRIKDTGIGMSAKARERLFEKFYRVQDDRTKNIVGTGLGLWITKQLVELQSGKITVDSIENVGTQITIIFPVEKQ